MNVPQPAVDWCFHVAGRRRVAYAIYGRADGPPVYFFHGLPGSRLQAALVHEAAAAAGLAVVAFDRPGFGASDPAEACSVDAVVGDVSDLADHLGHRRFGAIGVSCGGPYALAAARLLPRRVHAVGLLAGIGPMDQAVTRRGRLPFLRAMFALGRLHRRLPALLLWPDLLLFRRAPGRAVDLLAGLLAPPDRLLLQREPAVREAFGASLAEAYRQGLAGVLGEVRRIARLGSAGLAGVAQPVHVFQSGHDRHVPPATGRYYAGALPRGRLVECPDEGHLSIVVHQFAACAARVMQGA